MISLIVIAFVMSCVFFAWSYKSYVDALKYKDKIDKIMEETEDNLIQLQVAVKDLYPNEKK